MDDLCVCKSYVCGSKTKTKRKNNGLFSQYLHKDDQENAKKSIIFYYGKFTSVNSLNEILLKLNQQQSKTQQNKANFLAIFKSRENLRGCLVGCIVATTVGFSGVTSKI